MAFLVRQAAMIDFHEAQQKGGTLNMIVMRQSNEGERDDD